jgi:hypothetical protein
MNEAIGSAHHGPRRRVRSQAFGAYPNRGEKGGKFYLESRKPLKKPETGRIKTKQI